MSQHDFEIANQGFPAFRSDLNSGLQALASNSAGATEPSSTYAYQFWYETDTNLLKMRNADDDAWITLAYFDQTNDEWEIRSAVIQAVDSAGVSIKTNDGTTRIEIQDDGDVSIDSGTLFVDASENRVGIGSDNPSGVLEVRAGSLPINFTRSSGDDGQLSPAIAIATSSTNTRLGSSGDLLIRVGAIGTAATQQGESLRVDTSNNLDMTAGGGDIIMANGAGIDFSASEGGGATSSILDDYEEGTWTPVYASRGATPITVTYDQQGGSYVKVGNMVKISFRLRTDNVTGGSGDSLRVGGLPFTSFDNSPANYPATIGRKVAWGTSPKTAYLVPDGDEILLIENETTGALISTNDLATGSNDNDLSITVVYQAA